MNNKTIKELQEEADFIHALNHVVARAGRAKIKTADHGYDDECGHTPMYYDSLDIINHDMMYLYTCHEGSVKRGLENVKKLIKQIEGELNDDRKSS